MVSEEDVRKEVIAWLDDVGILLTYDQAKEIIEKKGGDKETEDCSNLNGKEGVC